MTGAIEGSGRTAGGTVLLLAADRRAGVRLTAALRRRGFGVLTPTQPAEALALARAVRPCVVLLDLRSAGLTFVCERLLEDGRCGRPALVLLVPRGVTVVPSLLPSRDTEVVEWDAVDLEDTVATVVTIADRQRDLRAASPLTGLPGNTAIRAELERRFAAGERLALLYVDLDAFKPYNDHYGFLRGDEVLRALAGILVSEARRHPGAFVGHVGGDDFVVVLPPEDAEGAAWRIVAAFDALVPHFYAPAEAARGWIAGHDRLGRRCRWSLLSASVGVARSDRRPVGSALELVDIATEMKRVAKRVRGGAVAVDQRSEQQPGLSWRVRALATAAAAPLRRAATVVVTLAVAAALFVPAGSALAMAKPGELLWPAARLVEDARLALADTESGVTLRLELSAERLADAVAALSVGEEDRAAAALTEYRRRNGEAVAQLAAIDGPARDGTLAQVAAAHGQHVRVLSELVETRCDVRQGEAVESCVALRAALAAASGSGDGGLPAGAGVPSSAPSPAAGDPRQATGSGTQPPDARPGGQGDAATAPAADPTSQPGTGTPDAPDDAAGGQASGGQAPAPSGSPAAGTGSGEPASPPVEAPSGTAADGTTAPSSGEPTTDPPATGEATTTPTPPATEAAPEDGTPDAAPSGSPAPAPPEGDSSPDPMTSPDLTGPPAGSATPPRSTMGSEPSATRPGATPAPPAGPPGTRGEASNGRATMTPSPAPLPGVRPSEPGER